MYTECPECQTAFRLTAKILKAAQGRVRCGGCGNTFNALDHLSEELPADDSSNTQTARIFESQSQELLDTLDELAGPGDVRIEDTGVEWRVLDTDDGDNDDGPADADTGADDSRPDDPDDSSSIQWTLEPAGDDSPANEALEETARHALDEPDDEGSTTAAAAGDDTFNASLEPDEFAGHAPDRLATGGRSDGQQRRATDRARGASDDTSAADEIDTDGADTADNVPPSADTAADDDAELTPADADDSATPGDAGPDELRFDDHTPLPDEFFRPIDADMLRELEAERQAERQAAASAAPPALPTVAEEPVTGGEQADLEFGDDDWADLLGEVADDGTQAGPPQDGSPSSPDAAAADSPDAADNTGETASAEEDALSLEPDARSEDDAGSAAEPVETPVAEIESAAVADTADDEQPPGDQTDGGGSDGISGDGMTFDDDDPDDASPRDEQGSDEPAANDDDSDDVPAANDDEAARSAELEIDAALMQAAAESAASDTDDTDEAPGEDHEARETATAGDEATEDDDDDDRHIESIVMQGDTVTGLEVEIENASYDDIPPPPDDSDDAGDRGWRRYGAIAAVLLLGLVLAAQLVHAHRESLATLSLFERAVAPIYRALGQPVTPAWDIRGWRFETTNGSTDGNDQHLTITSRIANRSEGPLPLPLVHVSLTDRYEEVIGSRILEPREYLQGGDNGANRVPAGGSFTAVVSIDAPAPDATGFKLNVCYPLDGGRVRCAIEDFKR